MLLQTNAPTSTRTALLSAFSIATLLLLTACGGGGGGDDDNGSVAGLSQHGSTNSHNSGQNCFNCHTDDPGNGTGEGTFITAGTATSAIGGYVRYYSDIARTDLLAELEIDAYGNFYTVTAIDDLIPMPTFSVGTYVSVFPAGGSRRDMGVKVSHSTAGCNECHGSSQGAL